MTRKIWLVTALLVLACFPADAQIAGEARGMRAVLDSLYDEMIPLSSQLIDVSRIMAGFGALWYIAARIWRHLANAEPIDFYPLLRPFALGMCIMMFPTLLTLMNAILKPTVAGTAAMVEGSEKAIIALLDAREKAIQKTPYWQMFVGVDGQGDREKWYRYTNPDAGDEGMIEGIGNSIEFAMAKAQYNFKNAIKQWLSEILQIIFEAAALCINTVRTFYLVVLAVLGPLVLGLSVFDGLQQTMRSWLSKYINVFLWLPVANIFGSILGKIQENMLKLDISQVEQNGQSFFSPTDTGYLIFLVIGIIGYVTVPSLANSIVQAAGNNTLLTKATSVFASGAQSSTTSASKVGDALGQSIRNLILGGGSNSNSGNQNDSHQRKKVSGE